MRWHRLISWMMLLALSLVALLAAVFLIVDPGVLKKPLEAYVEQTTGRELTIGGGLYIDPARYTNVVAEDVRLGNADWAEPDSMISLGRVELRIDLWSLLGGPTVIELLRIDDARVFLTRPEEGEPNWAFTSDNKNKDAGQDSPGPGVIFRHIELHSANVVLDSFDRERPLHLDIERLLQTHTNEKFVELDLRGTLDGRAIALKGEAGDWDAILAGKDFDFTAHATLDTFELSARGHIDDLANLRRPVVVFAAHGPDIDDLTRLLGLGEDGEGDIDLVGSLTSSDAGPMVLDIKGNVGQTKIDASGAVADLQSLDNIQLQATSSSPDIGRILKFAGIQQVRDAPFTLNIDAETQGGTFIINEASMYFAGAQIDAAGRMPRFPSIENAAINLHIEGPSIERFRYITGLPGEASGPFSAGLTVDVSEDGLQILDLDVETSLGKFRGDGNIGDPASLIGSALRFEVESKSLARLAGAYGVNNLPDKPIAIVGNVEYTQAGIRTRAPLTFSIDGFTGELEGLVPLTPEINGADLTFAARGPNLADLVGAFMTTNVVPALNFAVQGRVQKSANGVRLQSVTGSLGRSEIGADGLLMLRADLAGSNLELSAAGEAFEELLGPFDNIQVQPGAYKLDGKLDFSADAIRLSDIRLDREAGSARLNLEIGMPTSRQQLDFNLRANGRDVHSFARRVAGFEAYQQPFSIDVTGKLRGRAWTFDQLEVAVGDASIQVTGELDTGAEKSDTAFDFALDVPSLARLGTWDGRAFNDQSLSLKAHAAAANGVLDIDRFAIGIGSNRATGTARITNGTVPDVAVNMSAEKLALIPLLADAEAQPEADTGFIDGRVIPDIDIPLEALNKLNAEINVDIGQLQRDELLLKDVELTVALRDGVLNISRARYLARAGEMLATARLESAGGEGAASLQLVARDFAPGVFDADLDLSMTGNIDINVQSTGRNLRALAGNLNGIILLDARGGRVANNAFIDAMYGDVVREIFSTINPFTKTDPYTNFECIIVPLSIADGQVTATPSAFIATDKLSFASQALLNLKTERIQMQIRTTPRQRVSTISAAELLNPFVQVVGTLDSPRLAVDETGVLVSGGAAVATGGLSLLAKGVWDRISRAKDPCKQVSDQAIEQLGPRLPQLVLQQPAE